MSIRHGLGLLLQDINTEGGDDDDHRTPSLGQSPPAGDRPPGAQRDLRLRPGARLLPPPPLPALRHVDRRPCRVRKAPRPRGECDTRTVTVRVAVCGRLTVNRDGESLSGPRLGTRKARVLTAVLAAARGAPVSVDRLVEAVWGTTPPRDPQGNLATLASRLRRTAGDDLVVQAGAGYGLAPGVDLDLDAAAELHAAADARLRRREPTLAVAAAQRALSLLGGDGSLAEEFEDPWAEPLRREAAALAREARHLLAGAAVESGRADLAEQSCARRGRRRPLRRTSAPRPHDRARRRRPGGRGPRGVRRAGGAARGRARRRSGRRNAGAARAGAAPREAAPLRTRRPG